MVGFGLLLALCAHAAASQGDQAAVDAALAQLRDREVAALAEAAVSERCEDSFVGAFDGTGDRQALESAIGGENFVLDILTEAGSRQEAEDELTVYLEGEGGGKLVRRRVVGLAMFVLTLFLFPFFCATACSCCARYRVFHPKDEPRSTNFVFKVLGLVAVGAIGVGICVCWASAWGAHSRMSAGIDNTGCTSARLVQTTLEGQEDPKFIGMNGMVSEFNELSDVLDNDSPFVLRLNALIDDTEDIEVSVYLATQTLRLLSDMMAIAPNARPGGFHQCDFCSEIGNDLNEAVLGLENSFGNALADARNAAKEQLSEQNRDEIKQLLADSTQPITDLKDQIRDAFEPIVETDVWDAVQTWFNNVGLAIVMLLVSVAALLAAIATVAMLIFLFKEKDTDGGYNRSVPQSACCTWICAWILCLFCFVWGGFLEVLAVPLSSVCLVLDDISGDTIRDIHTSLEVSLDPSSDIFTMLTDSVDKCLNPDDPSIPANFVDILFSRSENGTKVTMRQQLEQQVEEQITDQFDELTRRINDNTDADLSNEPAVRGLRLLVANDGANVDGLIVTDRIAVQNSGEPWVAALPTDWEGYSAAVSCDDHEEMLGVVNYIAEENATLNVGLNFPNPPCPGVSGDGTRAVGSRCPSTTDADRCAAADWLLQKKFDVMTDRIFRCDVFEDDFGQTCDIRDMREPARNQWAKDCLRSDGTLRRRQVSCTLEEFRRYVTEFDQRIEVTMRRVDQAALLLADSINVQMRNDLEEFVLTPINEIIDGVKCNWLSEYYQETVWGLCYQGVVGLNTIGSVYVGLGFLLVLLIMVMYALWRRSVDNVKVLEDKMSGRAECGNAAPLSAV